MLWGKKPADELPTTTENPFEGLSAVLNDGDDVKTLRSKAESRAQNLDISVFPKEMSCMTCLDELMACMSLGGQVRNYYRYGDLTMCDKQNEKLNFCFSQSMKTGEERETNIQEFYKQRLVEELSRGSSEDIWESRN